MVIVLLADPLHLQHGDGPWKIEKANLNLVADFVASLPRGRNASNVLPRLTSKPPLGYHRRCNPVAPQGST
jgi:hypothetical protein